MKERGIIFSGDMVRAILDGRKTQTRRVVKPQPCIDWKHAHQRRDGLWEFMFRPPGKPPITGSCEVRTVSTPPRRAPYAVGDHLYVRETWALGRGTVVPCEHLPTHYIRGLYHAIAYRASDIHDPERFRWKPSIHMPKKYARIWLEVTGVRVERVQEITIEEMWREGCGVSDDKYTPLYGRDHDPMAKRVRGEFRSLWDSLNAKRGYGWNSNPWVWVYKFKRIEK